MQKIKLLILVLGMTGLGWNSSAESLFDFKVNTIDGEAFSFAQFKGKKKAFLIVNTASECGYTSQYEGLQELYAANKSKGLVVLAFPSNDFGGQEPGSNESIKKFCDAKFKVKFPMFEKGSVKGESAQGIYKWLTKKGGPIDWNFEKFLIGPDGQIIERFKSQVTPESEKLRAAIKKALG